MAKRGENIYKRKDGRWEGRYRSPAHGERKSHYQSVYGKSYREVKEKLLAKKNELAMGKEKKSRLPSDMTLGEAARLWLAECRGKWKDSTYATYRSIVEKHIIADLENMPIAGFSAEKYSKLFEFYGNREQKRLFSDAYLHQIHIVYGQIFHFLDRKFHCGMPERPSPAQGKTRLPSPPPDTASLQTLERYLLEKAGEGDLTSIGILLSGCGGLRIGEICALRWENVDFERGTVRITETMQRIRTFQGTETGTKIILSEPKSRTSNREVPLPLYLRAFLEKVKGAEKDFILKGKKKTYLEPRSLQYRFKKLLQDLKLPYFNFHMLRHVFATNCISRGFDMKTLSELLGHSNVTTTMRIYVHSNMERKKQLMADYRMAS